MTHLWTMREPAMNGSRMAGVQELREPCSIPKKYTLTHLNRVPKLLRAKAVACVDYRAITRIRARAFGSSSSVSFDSFSDVS